MIIVGLLFILFLAVVSRALLFHGKITTTQQQTTRRRRNRVVLWEA